MKKNDPIQVFLDANVVIEAGKPPGGPLFARVIDLVKGGFITVLTTDLTKSEVAKKHTHNDYEVIKEVGRPHFRKLVRDVTGSEIPPLNKTEIRARIAEIHATGTEGMFKALGAKSLSVDDVPASVVLAAYHQGNGFFAGEGKKDQFPDAFTFECLKKLASDDSPVMIISNDGDFEFPAKDEPHIEVLKSIPELFTHLGLEVEAPDIEDFIEERTEELKGLANDELDNWGLNATDVQDAYIDTVKVEALEIEDLTTFAKGKESDLYLVIGAMKITATVSYTHPDWDTAAYDSEDKVLIPFEDVDGEIQVEIEAEFSMSILLDENGEPIEIEDFRFTSDEFQWIELHPFETYK